MVSYQPNNYNTDQMLNAEIALKNRDLRHIDEKYDNLHRFTTWMQLNLTKVQFQNENLLAENRRLKEMLSINEKQYNLPYLERHFSELGNGYMPSENRANQQRSHSTQPTENFMHKNSVIPPLPLTSNCDERMKKTQSNNALCNVQTANIAPVKTILSDSSTSILSWDTFTNDSYSTDSDSLLDYDALNNNNNDWEYKPMNNIRFHYYTDDDDEGIPFPKYSVRYAFAKVAAEEFKKNQTKAQNVTEKNNDHAAVNKPVNAANKNKCNDCVIGLNETKSTTNINDKETEDSENGSIRSYRSSSSVISNETTIMSNVMVMGNDNGEKGQAGQDKKETTTTATTTNETKQNDGGEGSSNNDVQDDLTDSEREKLFPCPRCKALFRSALAIIDHKRRFCYKNKRQYESLL